MGGVLQEKASPPLLKGKYMKKKKGFIKSKVVKHLKGDIKTFKKEANEDREMIKSFSKPVKKAAKRVVKDRKDEGKSKMDKVLHEFKEKELHMGSKKGPLVKKKSQALAIGYSESRRAKKKK